MKKMMIMTVMALGLLTSVANAKASYECWMYKNGHPMWFVNVRADNNSEAQRLAAVKFDKIGRSGDYIKCH